MVSAASFRITRRGALGALAVGGAAAFAGCSVDTGDTGDGGKASGGADATAINFPDYSTTLPTDKVTFRWVDSGDLKSVYEKGVLDAFTKKHPNITTNYDGGGWAIVNKVVPLGVRNKNAPDIFAAPQGMPVAQMVAQNWVQPLEGVIPDFDTWKAAFPQTAFIPGVHVFDGKVYSFPLSSSRRLGQFLVYDKKNMAAAGYDDPASQIKTWDDLHTALTKVVKNGQAGLMLGIDSLAGLVNALAATAGWIGVNGVDFKTGKYTYGAPEVMQAFEFVQKLATDKLLVPGFLTLQAADARSQMSAGKSGMLLDGPWDIPKWKKESPDWEYSMGPLPSPDSNEYVVPFQENGANNTWLYAESKLTTVAGQIYAYMGSPEGQKMVVVLSQGNLVSLQPDANKAADQTGILDPNAKAAAALATKVMRSAPIVALRNPDVDKVDLVAKQVQPIWTDIMQGLFTGKLTDPQKQFDDYDTKLEASRATAIATAKAQKGSTITIEDYIFGNWDPTKDYTLDDYKALPGYKGAK